MAAIGPHHATDASISALHSLGGEDGRKLIDSQLRVEVLLKSETSLQTLKAVRKFLDRPGMRDALKRDPSIARGLKLAMESPTLAGATVSGDMMALQAVKTLGAMTSSELKSFTNMISTLPSEQRLALMKEVSALTAERRAERLR